MGGSLVFLYISFAIHTVLIHLGHFPMTPFFFVSCNFGSCHVITRCIATTTRFCWMNLLGIYFKEIDTEQRKCLVQGGSHPGAIWRLFRSHVACALYTVRASIHHTFGFILRNHMPMILNKSFYLLQARNWSCRWLLSAGWTRLARGKTIPTRRMACSIRSTTVTGWNATSTTTATDATTCAVPVTTSSGTTPAQSRKGKRSACPDGAENTAPKVRLLIFLPAPNLSSISPICFLSDVTAVGDK